VLVRWVFRVVGVGGGRRGGESYLELMTKQKRRCLHIWKREKSRERGLWRLGGRTDPKLGGRDAFRVNRDTKLDGEISSNRAKKQNPWGGVKDPLKNL